MTQQHYLSTIVSDSCNYIRQKSRQGSACNTHQINQPSSKVTKVDARLCLTSQVETQSRLFGNYLHCSGGLRATSSRGPTTPLEIPFDQCLQCRGRINTPKTRTNCALLLDVISRRYYVFAVCVLARSNTEQGNENVNQITTMNAYLCMQRK